MASHQDSFRKNFLLIILFAMVVSVLFVIGLVLGYKYIKKVVESEFFVKKVEVLEKNIEDYNSFFFSKLPEVSFYQGYLDSTGAASYADSVLTRFSFVEKILFYDAQLTRTKRGLKISPKAVYQFRKLDTLEAEKLSHADEYPSKLPSDHEEAYNTIIAKFATFLDLADTSRSINNDEISRYFYDVVPGKITYMNIPRKEDVKTFKAMLKEDFGDESPYEQDVFTFFLDPSTIHLTNTHPELYQYIEIRPLFYTMLDTDPNLLTSETPLPGALAGYKLYFVANRQHLNQEILKRFFPIVIYIGLGYLALFVIGYLIYRNIHFNHRMFKLQYDFVNNLTHEFKTPVSVIKIAGNNIRSAKDLNDKLRMHYGKILDDEAEKLNSLLNTLLSFTQIENRSIKLKLESINLRDFCENIIDTYKLRYPDFDLTCDMSEDLYLLTDRILLGSVFQNLIDNAYKYSKEDEKYLSISIGKQRKQMWFKFVDKGIGIPSNEQDNIFKKFYRVQSQYNQQGSVGLGLAFCKELINFMDGNISVRSVPGKGSTFLVQLPIRADS